MKSVQDIKKDMEFVRILIGVYTIGSSGIRSPIKTINIADTNVEEVYEMIKKELIKRGIRLDGNNK